MRLSIHSDEHFMRMALNEAKDAFQNNEIPIGAVITANNKVIAKASNQVEKLNDMTAHAEMLAITSAQNYLGSKYLDQCTIYVTLEPCVMCAGALFWSQIQKVVVGAKDPERGFHRIKPSIMHPATTVEFGLMAKESEALIKDFFRKLRSG